MCTVGWAYIKTKLNSFFRFFRTFLHGNKRRHAPTAFSLISTKHIFSAAQSEASKLCQFLKEDREIARGVAERSRIRKFSFYATHTHKDKRGSDKSWMGRQK